MLLADQAARFEKTQIPIVAVNGDTWDSDLQKGLTEDIFQGILTSPEMCLQHDEFCIRFSPRRVFQRISVQ